MRGFLVLLLAAAALLVSVSASATKLHTSQNQIQSADAVEPRAARGRMLLRSAAVDEEERGIMDAVKKLGKSTVKLPKNAYYKAYVNLKSTAVDIEKTANAFLHKSFNPDQVYKW